MPQEAAPRINVAVRDDATEVAVAGALTISHVTAAAADLAAIGPSPHVTLDLSATRALDSSGAWLLTSLASRIEAGGGRVDVSGASPSVQSILETVKRSLPEGDPSAEAGAPAIGPIEGLGRAVAGAGQGFLKGMAFFGLVLSRTLGVFVRPSRFRLTALVHHCEEVGLRAVPIVALMAFLIGVVLAFQGASQLRQFGAEVFVVDLIAVSILRELGILLTSIIVAGRTASAFTAAIGSMKMREEIDAMQTLGLDPAEVLFVPRILALLLMLPILGLIANLAGLFGGALMAWIELGISPALFQARLIEGTALSNVTVGLVKAPVFALIIGLVGCYAGMQVGNNAESLGQQTSKAVVAAIFAVIVADALFSVFFAEIGL